MVNKLNQKNLVSVIMGSISDWNTMKETCEFLYKVNVPFEKKIVSAHRTPHFMMKYAEEVEKRGIKVIIAGAGGAAHLPGMVASISSLPVIGVPILTSTLNGIDSLLSILQMPKSVPVATVAIGSTGAHNAAILAAKIISLNDQTLKKKLNDLKNEIKEKILNTNLK